MLSDLIKNGDAIFSKDEHRMFSDLTLPLPYAGTAEPCSKRLSGVTGELYRRPYYAQDHF
jgi:hypothetical protein